MISEVNEFSTGGVEFSSSSGQLDELNSALIQAYRSFNSTSDPVVMDACISQMDTIRARRGELLSRLRKSKPNGKENPWNFYQASP